MKRLVFLFIIFVSVIAISPFLIGEKGYILIAIGKLTIESTVVTASIFLFVTFVALLLLLRLCLGGIHFGKGTWRKITFANQRKAQQNFKRGIASYLIEDYNDAEECLIKSADRVNEPSMAYLLAASAAQKQTSTNKSANIEYYLKCLTELDTTQSNIEHVLVAIKLNSQLKNYSVAEQLLNQYHKHIGHDSRLLALAIDLAINQQHFKQAIDYLSQAYKTKAFSQRYIGRIESRVYRGYFSVLIKEKGLDALSSYWKELPRKEKSKSTIVLAYATVLSEHNLTEPLEALILPLLHINADKELVEQLGKLPIKNSDKLFKTVQKYVQKNPDNSMWLSYFAFLAFYNEQLDVAIKAYAKLFSDTAYHNEADTKLYVKALIQANEHQLASQVMYNSLLA